MKINLISILALFFILVSGLCMVSSSGEEDDEGLMTMKTGTLLGELGEYKGNDNDGEIESIGRFAVEEHNKKEVRFFTFFFSLKNLATCSIYLILFGLM